MRCHGAAWTPRTNMLLGQTSHPAFCPAHSVLTSESLKLFPFVTRALLWSIIYYTSHRHTHSAWWRCRRRQILSAGGLIWMATNWSRRSICSIDNVNLFQNSFLQLATYRQPITGGRAFVTCCHRMASSLDVISSEWDCVYQRGDGHLKRWVQRFLIKIQLKLNRDKIECIFSCPDIKCRQIGISSHRFQHWVNEMTRDLPEAHMLRVARYFATDNIFN